MRRLISSVILALAFGAEPEAADAPSQPASVDSLATVPADSARSPIHLNLAPTSTPADTGLVRPLPGPPDSLAVPVQGPGPLDRPALTLPRGTSFQYQAESLHYDAQGDSMILVGKASVEYGEARIEAAEMVYRRGQQILEARTRRDSGGPGEIPQIKRGQETIAGERIFYHMGTERGTVLKGRIKRKKSFYAGERIQTLSASEFHVHSGTYTTCDREHPHFDFYSPRIKVLVDNIAIARPVYLRVKEKRVLWIPFYVFSLREDRQSGILTPSFGRRSIRYGATASEWELRNLGYYFAPNDYWDLTLAGDFRQRSGWLARSALAYARRYHWDGLLETRLENSQSNGRNRWEWRTNVRHNHKFGTHATLRASGTFQSNKDFSRDNSANLEDRLKRTLRSNLSYSRRWRPSGNSLSLKASQTKHLDTDRFDQVLPEISLRKARKPLKAAPKDGTKPWYSRVYYDAKAGMRNARRGTDADTTTQTRADWALALSSQLRPLPWLNLNPGFNQSWVDRDLRQSTGTDRGVRTNRFNTSLGLTQTFYGLFHPQKGRIEAFRHVLKPNISLRYQATRTDTGGVFGVGGADSPWKQNRQINMRLVNTFWIKWLRGEKVDKIRLAQLNFSTSYNMERKRRPLADLTSSLRIEAGRGLNARFSLRSDFYDEDDHFRSRLPRSENFEINTNLNLGGRSGRVGLSGNPTGGLYSPSRPADAPDYGASGLSSSSYASYGDRNSPRDFGFESGLERDVQRQGGRRSLRLSHYFSRTRTTGPNTTRSWMRLSAGSNWGAKWHFQYALNYNLHLPGQALLATDRITSELLSVRREFHDWTATFNFEPSSFHRDRTFYFKAQFKDIPQIKFERGDRRR